MNDYEHVDQHSIDHAALRASHAGYCSPAAINARRRAAERQRARHQQRGDVPHIVAPAKVDGA